VDALRGSAYYRDAKEVPVCPEFRGSSQVWRRGPSHGSRHAPAVLRRGEPRSDRGEEPGRANIEPPDRDEASSGARKHAHRIGIHGRDRAADGLGEVEQPEAQTEAQVDRSHDAEVESRCERPRHHS
jgi:hypothetical protein